MRPVRRVVRVAAARIVEARRLLATPESTPLRGLSGRRARMRRPAGKDDAARGDAWTLHSIVGVFNNMTALNHSMRTNCCGAVHARRAPSAGGR